VDGAEEHVAKALAAVEIGPTEAVDAVLELAGDLFGEGEGDDVGGSDAVTKDLDDSGGDDLGLAGARTSDHLKIFVDGADGFEL